MLYMYNMGTNILFFWGVIAFFTFLRLSRKSN